MLQCPQRLGRLARQLQRGLASAAAPPGGAAAPAAAPAAPKPAAPPPPPPPAAPAAPPVDAYGTPIPADSLEVFVDGHSVVVPRNFTTIQACDAAGVDIPRCAGRCLHAPRTHARMHDARRAHRQQQQQQLEQQPESGSS